MSHAPKQISPVKFVGMALAGLGALVIVLLLLLQVPPVQRALLGAVANSALASSGIEARVSGTGGLWPWRIRAARIALSDSEGEFLDLDDIDVRLRPFALLGGSVAIDQLEIGGGTYVRQPVPIERAREPFRLPTLPSRFEVRRTIAVEEFVLGPFNIVVSADPVTVRGHGAVRLDRNGLNANVQLDAGDAGDASLIARMDSRARELSIDVAVSDTEGRWLAPLTPLGPGTPIAGTFRATGPQDRIVLASDAEWGAARFQMDGAADWRDSLLVSLEGTLRNGLSGSARALAGEEQTFETAFEVARDGSIRIDRAHVTSNTFVASLSGALGDEADISGEFSLRDTAALAPALGLEVLGETSVQFGATGPRRAAVIDVNGSAALLGADNMTAHEITFTIRSTLTREGAIAEGSMRAEAARISGEVLLPALQDQGAMLTATFRNGAAREAFDVQSLMGQWGPLMLAGEGDIAANGPMRFEGSLGADDLTQLDDRLSGAGHLIVSARRARRDNALNIHITSDTERFAAIGELAQWMGPAPHLLVEASVTDDAIDLATAEAALAAGNATVSGGIDRAGNAVNLEGQFASADLSVFAADLGGTMTGSFSATGPLSAPVMNVTVQSPALQSRGLALRDLEARLEDDGNVGRLTLRADGSAGAIVGDLPFTRSGEDLSGELTLSAVGIDVTGPIAFRGGVLQGMLHAASEDIADFVTLLRAIGGTEDALRAHGALDADFTFEGRQGTASLTISNPALEGVDTPAFASNITLSAALDLSEAPSIDGQLVAEGVRFGPSRFSVIDAKARGPFADLGASLSLRGPAEGPFHLDVEAVRREAGAGSEITLTSAEGRSLDFEVELASGGTLTIGPEGVELLPTAFAVRNLATTREGVLAAEARLWAGSPYAQITAEDVPAGSLAVFGLPVDWTGILNGEVTLDARGQGAPLRVALTASELTNDPDLAPLNARLTVEASGADLEAQLALTDTANGTSLLTAQSTVPLVWQVGRFTPATDWDAPLSGFVRASAPLIRLWPFVPVDTIAVGGALDADVTIAGTLGSPQARGQVHVAQGTLEHFQSGFILREAQGTLSFDQTGDLTAEIRATDGNGGTADLAATAHLPRAEAWMVDGTLRLNELTVARRDELQAQASGDLRLSGSLAEARLEGAVTMDRIDAQIPSQLPPSVVDLPVVYVDGEGTLVESRNGNDTAQALDAPLELDVTVNIPRRAFVRGRGLDSEWSGSLALGGTMSKPRISGTVSIVRGTFDLSRSRFDLTEGAITFLGGDRMDPQVRIEGQAPGPDFTSIIRARGPARSPTLTITSDPVMPQETVMSQILFGKRPEDLSAFELVQIGEATASLSGAGGLDLLGAARRATGLDVLSIGSRETSTGEQGVDVTVGRYVAPNVFVGARRGFEPGSGAVTVEMEVTPQVRIDAEVRQDSEGSVGIDWRRDY